MGLATCSLACDWTSRAVGLIAVRRAVNIFVVFVGEDGVIKRGDRSCLRVYSWLISTELAKLEMTFLDGR